MSRPRSHTVASGSSSSKNEMPKQQPPRSLEQDLRGLSLQAPSTRPSAGAPAAYKDYFNWRGSGPLQAVSECATQTTAPDISLDTSFVDPAMVQHQQTTARRRRSAAHSTPVLTPTSSSRADQAGLSSSRRSEEPSWVNFMLHSTSFDSDAQEQEGEADAAAAAKGAPPQHPPQLRPAASAAELSAHHESSSRRHRPDPEDLLDVIWHGLLDEAHETSFNLDNTKQEHPVPRRPQAQGQSNNTPAFSSQRARSASLYSGPHPRPRTLDRPPLPTERTLSMLFPLPPSTRRNSTTPSQEPSNSSNKTNQTNTLFSATPRQQVGRRHSTAHLSSGRLPPAPAQNGKRRPSPLKIHPSPAYALLNVPSAPMSAPPAPPPQTHWREEQELFLRRRSGDRTSAASSSSYYHWSQFDASSPRPNSYGSYTSATTSQSDLPTPRSSQEEALPHSGRWGPGLDSMPQQHLQAHDAKSYSKAPVWVHGDEDEGEEGDGCVQWGMAL